MAVVVMAAQADIPAKGTQVGTAESSYPLNRFMY